MKKVVLSMLLATTMVVGFTGCSPDKSGTSSKSDYDIYIYNSKGENAQQFTDMAKEYEKETGVKVKTFSIGSGQDHMEALRADMNSKSQPTIFSIQGLKELKEWEQSGKVMDFKDAKDSEFKSLVEDIPENLRLTSDGNNSYGVPYNVEGYGYIVNKDMIADMFDVTDTADILKDMKACSYDDWSKMVIAMTDYIKAPSAASVKLNGNTYKFKAAKGTLASNLTGVFDIMGAETWTYGDHLLNIAINTQFKNSTEAQEATDEQIKALEPAFTRYAQTLDLKTQNMAGANGAMTRGQDFVSKTITGYDAATKIYSDSKAVFIKQGIWLYGSLEANNPEIVKNLTFLPVKMPFEKNDIATSTGYTVEQLNSSIPVFVPNYYAINATATDKQKTEAEKFLVWLNTSEKGQYYITDPSQFAFVPYNADPATTKLNNSLGNSILEYMKDGKTVGAPYNGSPANWSSTTVGEYVMKNYLTKAKWETSDYNTIAKYASEQWITLSK